MSFMFVLLLISAIFSFVHGLNIKSLGMFIILATCVLISYYFESRGSEPASKFDKSAADLWLSIRRFFGFSASLLFGYGAVAFLFTSNTILTKIGVSVLSAVLAAICFWVAVYGQGMNRFDWKDDVQLHKKNKKRYFWKW